MAARQPHRVPTLDDSQRSWVEAHLWLAKSLAREMAWLAPKTIDDDVLGPANVGLVKAAARFDPTRGKTLATFAYKWIVGEILDAVDRKLAGSAKRYRAALGGLEDEVELADEGAGQSLDHAAAAMCICSISLRWAQGLPSERGRVLEDVLAGFPDEDQAIFLGHTLEGVTWEMLASEAGVSVSTVKRRVAGMRATLIARLRARGVRGSDD